MKSKLACLLLIAWPLLCFAEDGIIPPGRVFLSPDKSMYVKLLDYDREYHYAITDNKTGKVSILEARFNPVFAIAWSSDSRSIFAAVHVARGAVVQVLHLANNQWNIYTIDPPEQQSHESIVIDWNIKPTALTLVCKVGLQRENGTFYALYVYTFDVDPSTGKTSNLRKKQVTREDFIKINSKFIGDYCWFR